MKKGDLKLFLNVESKTYSTILFCAALSAEILMNLIPFITPGYIVSNQKI
jgi:hypothetical protein